jgi:hypothetical protein
MLLQSSHQAVMLNYLSLKIKAPWLHRIYRKWKGDKTSSGISTEMRTVGRQYLSWPSTNSRNETLSNRVLKMALFTIGFCFSTDMFVTKHGYFASGSFSYTSIIFSIISHSLSLCKSSTKTYR